VIGQKAVALAEASGDPGVFSLGTYQLDELLLLGKGRKDYGEAKDVGLADTGDEPALVVLGQVTLRLGRVDVGGEELKA